MVNEKISVNVLSSKIISNVSPELAKELNLSKNQRSVGIITTDCDDVTYVAVDEATKAAQVEVVYAKSMYAGAANASTKFAGEVIAMIAGPNPAEVKSGIAAAINYIENSANFYTANDDGSVAYFAHCISRTGTYLSKEANIEEGQAIAYLVAPPAEAMIGLDVALKSADVKMASFFGPPTETNFGGGLLTGSQSACKAACDAFANAIVDVANNPRRY